ncbi:MAG: molybdate ABC transporter substrate-binding protein [Gammaproteobacteria bacterium]|nr:molybdate ABC transporter substrate-binding protein [Gammaproteobacteria bacterium]MBU1414108.1 molybdate ABC transporter substrate-binding protein [Gammaproteobacteria bacterium]
MKFPKSLVAIALLALSSISSAADKITIAAAADLKFAMEEIVTVFKQANPAAEVETIYGSSGKFHTQIQQGAPFDLYFSADIKYPQMLAKEGFAASEVKPYAFGRIVLWSASRDASKMTIADLADPAIAKIAIANPKHAPYGKRAEEALHSAGIWEKVEPRLVMGENIAQTAQYVQTGNADIGIIALALALNKELASKGNYALIPDNLHQPLEQGFIVTKLAADNVLAKKFAAYMGSPDARRVMVRYGFILPGEMPTK